MLISGWVIGGKKVSTKEKRWYKDVGLGFKTPAEAIQGTYIGMCLWSYNRYGPRAQPSILDKKCPFTGEVSIRGRILTGRVVSTKMTRTIVIRRDYLHYIPKYSAHYPAPSMRTYSYFHRVRSMQTGTRSATGTLQHMFHQPSA